jgi:arginine deiminase
MAVAPGVILLYDRNVRTAEALDARGFRVIEAEDVLLGNEELDMEAPERTCILLSSHEISRARGGPHCLTHPLVRDDP